MGIELDTTYEQAALKATRVMGLRVAGVDMLEAEDGPKVMEVNASPGLEGIERATGVDVAAAVVNLVEEEVLFPDIDLRERLALRQGFGIAEVRVPPVSSLAHKSLADSGLKDQEVTVLTVTRGSINIPYPRTDLEILPGDVLLCFGSIQTLKGLVPPLTARRKRKPAKK